MQKDISPSVSKTDLDDIPLRSIPKAYFICVVMCLSAVYHGYCLTLIPATSTPQLRAYYHISAPLQLMLSLLNGIYPVGALVGCLILPFFIGTTNKKNFFYIFLLFSIVATSLSAISSLESLLISRFILGVLTAFYTSISTLYLKQTFQTNIKKPFGAIYSCGRFFGMLLAFVLAEIFHYAEDQIEHILVFTGPSFIALIQAILIFLYVPHSPVDLLNSKDPDLLHSNLSTLYHPKHIPIIAAQFKKRVEVANRMTVTELGLRLVSRKNILSFHLALLRQFCGITFIVVYARQIMIDEQSPLANISPLIINSVQFASGLLGIFMASRFKRKEMVKYSTMVITVIMILIGVADLIQSPVFSLVMMTLFMVPCASCLLSVIWSYPSELAVGANGKYASLISWSGTAVMLVVPPYVTNAMPDKAAYPIFFFCALYLLFSCIVNYYVIVEIVVITEMRSKKQIELTNRELLVS